MEVNNTQLSGRIFGLDLIKALSMTMVVLYHFGSTDFGEVPSEGFYFPNLSKIVLCFCAAGVPLFFMVNGALTSDKDPSFNKCMMKSGRLLFVACFWTIIFSMIVNPILFKRSIDSFGSFINHYWFLYTLVFLYWANSVLYNRPVVRSIVLLFLLLFPFISNLFWTIYLAFNMDSELPSWGHDGFLTLYAILYYYLGVKLYKMTISPTIILLFILLGLVFLIGEVSIMSTYYKCVYDGVNSSFPTIGAMFLSIGLFMLLKDINLRSCAITKRIIEFIGRNTIGIYVFHLFFIGIIKTYFFNSDNMPVVVVYLSTLLVVCVCALASNFVLNSRLRFTLKL